MSHLSLFAAAFSQAAQTAILDANGEYSFQQLLDRSSYIARALLESAADLNEQRVAFLVEPSFEYVAVQWGIWQAGGVAVPLGFEHPPPELEYVVDDADISAIIVQPELSERVTQIAATRSIRLLATAEMTVAARTKLPRVAPSRRAVILYTSGSTGKPKGVVTTHAMILAQVDTLIEAWQWQSSDHILHVLPLHHVHGIINVLSCAMRVGAVCEFLPKFDAQAVWERFAAGGLTLFMAVPTIYAKLIAAWDAAPSERQHAWSEGARQLRLMVSGSAALPVPTLERWQAITDQRLLERYGMTEIGMALSNPLSGERRPGYVGRPLPGVEVRRRGEQGQPVDDATPGEIEVRGPNVFLEYWRQPAATRDSFRDGWFRTGDIAVVDRADYRILGRSSVDIIKTGGYKLSALQIEDVLRCHPSIGDCAVVGVADTQWGERVALCAVLSEHASLDLDSLRDWAKQRLAAYKVPTLLHICDELPCNAMGKVQKPRVRALFEAE